MKTIENSIIQFEKNQVEFFLSKKLEWNESEISLTQLDKHNYSNIQNKERKIEFLGIRFLRNCYDSKLEINYLKSGKPVVENGSKHISISHSKEYIAFAVAPYQIGIDVEEIHERIMKVRDRFLNQNEQELFNQNSIKELTIAWCVKEVLFKLNEDSGLNFKTDLIITAWDKYSTIHAKMKQQGNWLNVNLHFKIKDNLVLCFNFE